MRMRSVAVLMQVVTSIDVNHIAGNEITLDRESMLLKSSAPLLNLVPIPCNLSGRQ